MKRNILDKAILFALGFTFAVALLQLLFVNDDLEAIRSGITASIFLMLFVIHVEITTK